MTIPHNTPPGTRVRFKTWEHMADQFGVAAYGAILVPSLFTPGMRNLCGTEAIVSTVDCVTVTLSHCATPPHWVYSRGMFELFKPLRREVINTLRNKQRQHHAQHT